MDDNNIIELYFARDENAIKETACAYGKKLDRLSFGIMKDMEDAKECVNDTYLKHGIAYRQENQLIFLLMLLKYAVACVLINWIIKMPKSGN